jgi:hypothetical protein
VSIGYAGFKKKEVFERERLAKLVQEAGVPNFVKCL